MTAAELQAYLHRSIPLSAAMGVRVLDEPDGGRRYEADLGPNVNHGGTAFGGSVSTLAIIAGWARVHTGLLAEGVDAHTVIQRNTIEYERPGTGPLVAICGPIAGDAWNRLVRGVVRHGKGRVRVDVTVHSQGSSIARYSGAYVALLP